VPEVIVVQWAPPSAVWIIVPARPTAVHWLASAQLMPLRLVVMPVDAAFVQVPPLVVLRTIPASPVAKHVCSVGQLTAWSGVEGPELGDVQVVPPSLVTAIHP
jgi:hypothetical protein